LVGVSKLNNIGVIHFDLKENNIMCRDKDGRPILIDFGLSITKDLIDKDKKGAFFIYGPDYPTWCFDICFIGYIIYKLKDTDIITESVLSTVIDEYFLQNVGMKELFSLEEVNNYKKSIMEYSKQFIGKIGTDVINELSLLCNSWDNYSIAVIYLNILKTMEIPESPIISKFIGFLKRIILSVPAIRPSAEQSKKTFETEFTNISKSDNKKLLQILYAESNNITKNENRRSNIIKSILSDRKREVVA
jgi:serine/threonine protein kinase